MITVEQSNEIIKYRAAAYSYDAISNALNISKPTVMRICKERENDILDARKIAWENGQKRAENYVDKRREIYQALLENACDVLRKRNLSEMSNKELIQVIRVLEQNLASIEITTAPHSRRQNTSYADISDEVLGEMVMTLQADYAYQNPEKYPLNEE